MDKERIIENIEKMLSNMFVEEFDKINNAKNSINEYFQEMEIEYTYDYNNFCLDFMKNSKELINESDINQLNNFQSNIFVFEVLTYMIENKINEIINDETTRKNLIMKHELKKYLLNK